MKLQSGKLKEAIQSNTRENQEGRIMVGVLRRHTTLEQGDPSRTMKKTKTEGMGFKSKMCKTEINCNKAETVNQSIP